MFAALHMPTALAEKNLSAAEMWNQPSPQASHSPQTFRVRSSTLDHPETTSSLPLPPRGWDAQGYRSAYCSSPAHRPESSKPHFSFGDGRRVLWCGRGIVIPVQVIFPGPHDRCVVQILQCRLAMKSRSLVEKRPIAMPESMSPQEVLEAVFVFSRQAL